MEQNYDHYKRLLKTHDTDSPCGHTAQWQRCAVHKATYILRELIKLMTIT